MKKILLILFLFVSACMPLEKQIQYSTPFEYKVEDISFDLEDCWLEPLYIYNNKFHMVEIMPTGHNSFFTDRLFVYDFITEKMVEVTKITKEKEKNRIWDFIQLEDDHFIYIEVENLNNYGYDGPHLFSVYELNGANKKMITSGYRGTIMAVPEFRVINDKIYLLSMNKIDEDAPDLNDENVPDSVPAIELWEFSKEGATNLYKTSNGDSERIHSRLAYNNDEISFIVKRKNEYQKISLKENKVARNTIWKVKEDERIQTIPLPSSVLVSSYNVNDTSFEDIDNYLVSENHSQLLPHSYDFLDYIQMGDKVFFISDDGKGVYVFYEDDKNLYIDTIKDISQPVSFRKIDENRLLVDADTTNTPFSWKIITIEEDEH